MSVRGRLITIAVLAAMFAFLTVHAVTEFWLAADEDVLRFVYVPELEEPARVVSWIGSGWGITVAGIVGVVLLWRRGDRYSAMVFAVATSGASLNPLLKLAFDRPRPDLFPEADELHDTSFPSGHTAGSAALAFALIGLCWHTRHRVPVTVVAVTFTLAVGLSRMELGVHYGSDLVGAWCWVGIWVIGVHLVAGRWRDRRSGPAHLDDADVGARADPDRRSPVAEAPSDVQPGSVDAV